MVLSSGSGSSTVTGRCVKYEGDIYDAADACYEAESGNPVPGDDLCGGPECSATCCIDSSDLCGGSQAANCPQGNSGACDCKLTYAGVANPCTTEGGLVVDPNLPPSGGGNGCDESQCNSYAAQYLRAYPGLSATCCSFCPTTRRSDRRRRALQGHYGKGYYA